MNVANRCSDCGGTGREDYVSLGYVGSAEWAALVSSPGLEDYVTANGQVEDGLCGTCYGAQHLPSITADPE